LEAERVIDANEMLGIVLPSAIKYCVTKGWLIPRVESGPSPVRCQQGGNAARGSPFTAINHLRHY
jgi:hypothetical protein